MLAGTTSTSETLKVVGFGLIVVLIEAGTGGAKTLSVQILSECLKILSLSALLKNSETCSCNP